MAALNNVKSTGVETAKDMSKKTRSLARTTSARVQKGGEQTYKQARRGLRRVQLATTVGGALLQAWLLYNKKRAGKNLHQATKQAEQVKKQAGKNLHQATKQAEQVQHTMQKKLQPAWSKTQDAFLDGRDAAQDMLEKQAKNASKQLKAVQKNIPPMQRAAQKNITHLQKAAQKNVTSGLSRMQEGLESGWSATQDILEEGSHQVQKGLTQLGSSAKDTKEAMRKRYKHAQRKRARARMMFRWGVVIGLVATLLFTPVAGSEVRQRIKALWDRCQQYLAQD